MLQRLFSVAMLIVCVLWLVISYMPGVQAQLPIIALPTNSRAVAISGVVVFAIFILIQVWLVYSTVGTVRAHQAKHTRSPFNLRIGAELFWTALPIAMTVALAWASYALWLGQSAP